MLRQLSVIALFVFSVCFLFGASSRSQAQLTVSNSWAGYGNTTLLICGIQGFPIAGGGFGGTFNASGSTWTATGAVVNVVNNRDASGNMSSTVSGLVYYYPITNGQYGSVIPARATYVAKQMADGSSYEGVWISNWFTGALLYATGMNRDGTPLMFSLTRGSLIITQ